MVAGTYGVGDRVVHPAYGAGVVRRVVQRTIAGEPRQYYVIEPVSHDGMEVMVPVEQVALIGLRSALGHQEMSHILAALGGPAGAMSTDSKERQQQIRDRLDSGDPYQVAEAARDLAALRRGKGSQLGTVDTRLLIEARQSLAAELAVIESVSLDAALGQVDEALLLTQERLGPRI